MIWDQLDWTILDRLRARFLKSEPGAGSYWQSESDLVQYDLTYAQRIAWKWLAVLAELRRLSWTPPSGPIVDWGCGSGVASRCVIAEFGTEHFESLRLADQSSHAIQFAARRARERFPALSVSTGVAPQDVAPCGTLVLSHVLNELNNTALAQLLELVQTAACVVWVEAGTSEVSARLIQVRERLRETFHVVAPCPHRGRCGLLAPDRERDWCHFFAAPPSDIFADGNWVKFGQRAGIDLRSLPYSYLVLDRRPVTEWSPDRARILGRPEIFKPYARVITCQRDGVRTVDVSKRESPNAYRHLRDGDGPAELSMER
jgi:hypothetical protein